MRTFRGTLVALASLAVGLALVGSTGVPAAAQEPRPNLVVTVSGDPKTTAASLGTVIYTILVKNDGTIRALNVVVTIPMPAGTTFSKCTMTSGLVAGSASTACTPGPAAGTVTIVYPKIKAHLEPRITLTLTMPSVSSPTILPVDVDANGDDVNDGKGHTTTTVLPAGSLPVAFLPSGRIGSIACGLTLSPDIFEADTTVQLSQDLICTGGPYGLKITATGKTIDLNLFKIFWNAPLAPGKVGILVSNATDVTIIGGSTGGNSGIEKFDWCVKDEGVSTRLTITSLRCFKARTAGFDIIAKKATLTGVLVDRAIGTASTTAELPGGVGIRTRGDNTSIKDSIARGSGSIGIWVAGTDNNGDGRVASITGSNIASSTSKMRIENGTGIGLLLDGGPHFVKNLYVDGVYNDRDDPPVEGKNGVVVGPTGLNNLLDSVVVKQHGGHAFVVDGTGTTITNSNVDGVGLDGFVVNGTGSTLSGNGVQNARSGFIVTATGLDTDLNTNETEELDEDGFVVDGDNPTLTGNTAQSNGGRGFVIGGDSSLPGANLDSNTAEKNVADGFIVTGNGHGLKNNKSKSNGTVSGGLLTATGFTISGTGNRLNTNLAEKNTGSEWVIGPDNVNEGSNRFNGTVFQFTDVGVTKN